ncbi:MAG TPA: bifunctional homocysteine S-methyltransferase/methylenetetrahydrofolate reductase [Bacillota bacterium]|nr:bifunctional homocysteine S-methyltransferase/methylenetetrahydrofolate reductase [Bacillota bacterium]
MKKDLLAYLEHSILVGDGAMGTLLHRYGVPVGSCGEELNLTRPDVVKDIHLSYLKAGAQLIETNTYGANLEKLSKYGLEDQIDRINRAAVQIAREAAAEYDAFVVGAVGGIQGGRKRNVSSERLTFAYEEQLKSLLEAGVDGILLETFCQVDEAELAISIAKRLGNVPVICQLSIQDTDRTQDGIPLGEAFSRLREAGADIVGLNCYNGPAKIIKSLEGVDLADGLILSAYPNAGIPEYVDGKYLYSSTPDYFGKSAQKLYELGVRIIGGCCGTTPAHIAEIASHIQGSPPIKDRVASIRVVQEERTIDEPAQSRQEKTIPELVKERPTVIVELDPPRDLDYHPFLEGAAQLKEAGADAITLADNSLAMTRMSNMALGSLMKDAVGIRPLVHLACRDRNSIGQQSHLMGLYALGIDHVLAVTGDPTRYGDLPGASSVYDMTSFEMIRMIKQLNEGKGYSGRPMKKRASFTVAAAFNPNTRHLHKAVERLHKKVEAGADYVMSQPLYDHEQIVQVAEATKDIKIPIFIGIMPLISSRNAEFMHNEVPGIRLSDNVRTRMSRFEGEDARKQGTEIAMELIETAKRYFQGIYLITPFMRYEMTAELTRFVRNGSSNSL